MVNVSLTARLAVRAGPTLVLDRALEPESYTVTQVLLPTAGGADSDEVPLLPAAGNVVLLAIKVSHPDGRPATVAVVPKNGDNQAGPEIEVTGSLLVAHEGVLRALVPGGPRTLNLTLKDQGSGPIVVDVLAGLSA